MREAWLILLVGVMALGLTGVLRRYALARSLMDIPNARSSHSVPTPRGGGVAIVLAYLFGVFVLTWLGILSPAQLVALAGAGGAVALIGFMDDHGHIAARWRLLGHFAAAIWGLWWLGGLPPLMFFGRVVDLGWMGHVLAAFYLVWMLNLYNFMDGIDGIAGVEAVCVCAGAALLYGLCGEPRLSWACLMLAAAAGGFLYWNFPPARIFMGDAGSGFLGIMIGLLALQGAHVGADLFWMWLILPGVFIVDATATLLRRLARGDRVHVAHRSHAYQFASRRHGKHLPVTLAVGAINLLWLLPIAASVVLFGLSGPIGVIIAYGPLIILALKYNAGALESA